MHPKIDFETLLERYLDGECTPEEEILLERFFEESGDQQKEVLLSEDEQLRLFTAFRESVRFRTVPATGNKLVAMLTYKIAKRAAVWKVAASILVLFGCWKLQQQFFIAPLTYKQISNPQGKLMEIMLPDSTNVILNANSTLRYAEDFNKHRNVQLTGEAMFSVTKDQAHPFIIESADSIETTVLGTSFTVRSYSELAETKIMVLSGKIQVQRAGTLLAILDKDKVLSYNHQNKEKQLMVIPDADKHTGWVRGEWEYDRMGIRELQSLLHNYYNVQVMVKGPDVDHLLADANMNFNNRQSADDILDIFCITTHCKYKWLNKTTVELYRQQ